MATKAKGVGGAKVGRTYGDRCGVARALDVVGERWALLIVRELLLGPKRFTDLRAGLPHVSPDVLSQRLRELEEAGVLQRTTLPPPARSRGGARPPPRVRRPPPPPARASTSCPSEASGSSRSCSRWGAGAAPRP